MRRTDIMPVQQNIAQRRDIHAEITAKLIASIEADPGQPSMPWRRSSGPLFMPSNALTGNAYNGINIVSLWVSAEVSGFTAPVWATYRQWSELGAQVRKGEKSSLVVFYKEYDTDPNPDVADDDGKRRVARASYVFNASQVDGFTVPAAPERLGPVERIEAADRFVGATGVRVEHGGERAYYRPSTDHIQMPDEGLFCGTDTMTRSEGYFAVLLHETIHASGAKHRLDRDMGKRFGDAAYAAEELVAEIGSAFLCSELGITQDVRADHAQYLANWLKLLKDDSRAIFSAAAKASEAVAYLKRLQPPA
jgi:antirestriction protein ArdC